MNLHLDSIGTGRTKIPGSVTLVVCATCGRTNRHDRLSVDGSHWYGGKPCPGRPQHISYIRMQGTGS